MPTATPDCWITRSAAAALIGVDPRVIDRLVADRKIGVRVLGRVRQLWRADVERLLTESITTARTTARE